MAAATVAHSEAERAARRRRRPATRRARSSARSTVRRSRSTRTAGGSLAARRAGNRSGTFPITVLLLLWWGAGGGLGFGGGPGAGGRRGPDRGSRLPLIQRRRGSGRGRCEAGADLGQPVDRRAVHRRPADLEYPCLHALRGELVPAERGRI